MCSLCNKYVYIINSASFKLSETVGNSQKQQFTHFYINVCIFIFTHVYTNKYLYFYIYLCRPYAYMWLMYFIFTYIYVMYVLCCCDVEYYQNRLDESLLHTKNKMSENMEIAFNKAEEDNTRVIQLTQQNKQ